MRITKKAEERKHEILDAAEQLFASKGFEQTSTNDILVQVGIARGTLYHHFKSKEEILDGVISRLASGMVEKAREIAGQKEIPLIQRLTMTILALNMDSSLGVEVLAQMHKPHNALMRQKIQQQLIEEVVPVLSDLVEEGIEAGLMDTACPKEAMEMIMLYVNVMFDHNPETDPVRLQQRIHAFIYNVEKLLGARPGALEQTLLDIFTATGQPVSQPESR